ncbi:MAG: flagellar hook-length control protein FliK [Betaproteobacteria bacterium]
MIRPEALTRLRLLVGAVRPPLVAGDSSRELPPLSPGQPVDGTVEQQTRAGFIVSISGRHFEIKLPVGTRPGDLLRMVYVNDDPRPTFALLRMERGGEPPASRLSDAGKLLAMLQEVEGAAPDGPAATETAPIYPARIPETPAAANLLREALALSGLFYESHQAQWVLGTRTTAQLQREPQGRLMPLPQRNPDDALEYPGALQTDNPVAGDATARRADAAPADLTLSDRDAARRMSPAQSLSTSTDPTESVEANPAARSPAHPDTYPIIRQQLSTLESGLVEWRGTVWPGQSMAWQVSERRDEPGGNGEPAPQDGETPRTWRTEMRLTLPNIGHLVARIELDANGARVRLVSDSAQQARVLRAEAPVLANRLGAAGIAMHAFETGVSDEAA